MKKGKFKTIIYLISFTVIVTLGIQVYRNLQNYQLNKQQLINDVQVSLDNAVETYYADLAKEDPTFQFISTDSLTTAPRFISGYNHSWVRGHNRQSTRIDSLLDRIDIINNDSTLPNGMSISFNTDASTDSVLRLIDPGRISSIQVFNDSIVRLNGGFNRLANNLVFSMINPLELDVLANHLKDQLADKAIDLGFGLKRSAYGRVMEVYNNPENPEFTMEISPKSTYQYRAQQIEMRFANASLPILKRGLTDMIISVLISVIVIGVLLYLYKVINQQKQLAEIKNDLISNITHEFKTPIATVASALEGIANFNRENDPAKTRKYLDISGQQLKKLNVMVEKLLETATLETDALELNKTPVNLSQLMHSLIEKYRLVSTGKEIDFQDHSEDAIIEADAFHLENALSNLIDNAIKYGGDEIWVSIAYENEAIRVVVQDNGGFIEKSQKERVFDKFYRIPKGNRHDVKGFGIGLYYTRKIIEKHGGTIDLILSPNRTSFEIAI